jgi:CRP-like cAMP-binding protein
MVVGAGWEIVREGDRLTQSCLILAGVCCCFKIVCEGARQIVSIHIPSDLPDLQSLYLQSVDHNFATLTPSRIALLPHRSVHLVMQANPRLGAIVLREG